MIILSNVFHKNRDAFKAGVRYIVNRGGTSSTKTFSILQLLTDIARKTDMKIDVLGQTVPHLKDGVLTDMPHVCKGFGIVFENYYNKSEKVFKPKGTMNFISIDKIGKALGGRRDILYINEANHIPWAIVEQLMIRTRIAIFIDFNPTSKFWLTEQVEPLYADDMVEIRSTYLDNTELEPAIVKAIEAKKGDNNFWRVFGLGEYGRAEGLIFTDYETNCMFDKESFDQYRHGVDWGFSVDPFSYNRIAIDKKNMIIYICDEIHGRNLQNTVTAPMVIAYAGYEPVYCDSSEPKSVAEYDSLGVNAYSAKKGPGSIETGVKYIQRYKVKVHSDCPHTADEFNNYSWKMDRKTGEPLNVPEDNFNHHIDGIRYALEGDMSGDANISFSFF
jgi:phage terminase large subunit